jgi:hypothetical protein
MAKRTTSASRKKTTPKSKSRTPGKRVTTKRAAHAGSRPQDLRKKVVNADRPLTLRITEQHIKSAKCKDPAKCVIAQALADTGIGQIAEEFQVGATCTKIATEGVILRYATPYKLRNALRTFDNTGHWHLPAGEYTLTPYKGATRRWETAKRNGGKQDLFVGRVSAPTRFAKSIATLRKAA